ncbi:MAG: acyl-ACP--UDP-N-acetylglucosamine O-acyltransferase [Proteobacteria bacterium]|nr:acyl-ACP--UDP-N-acetylglucosamine O-acyltransferase [Pseudomonadota bacterium]
MYTQSPDTSQPQARVHPTALVEPGARLGARCVIHAYAIVGRHCRLDEGVVVHSHAVLGGDPQDLRFDPAVNSGVHIGARTVIREHVTVNRSTRPESQTVVGADCFLMASSHVAHDCVVGERVVMANAVLLAGHVHVGAHAFIGGNAVVHQFCRIGESAMIGGGARISSDVPCYLMASERNTSYGLNLVGLRRRGVGRDALRELKALVRELDPVGSNVRKLAQQLLEQNRYVTPEARQLLAFYTSGTRPFVRRRRDRAEESTDD